MTAPQLLATIESRGGQIAVVQDVNGQTKLQISPRGLVGDLAGEISRFKPALVELLTTSPPSPRTGAAPTLAQVDAARRRINPALRLDDSERDELAFALAQLDMGIDPHTGF